VVFIKYFDIKLGIKSFINLIDEKLEKGEITQRDAFLNFEHYIAKTEHPRNTEMSNLLTRMDYKIVKGVVVKQGRTLKTFEVNIKDGTLEETRMLKVMLFDLKDRGCKCKWKNNGVDNTGGLIVEDLKNLGNGDFLLQIDKLEGEFDMKGTPAFDRVTIRVDVLERAIEKGMYFLIPIGCKRETFDWAILGPEALHSLLTLRRSTEYRGFGGKSAIMIGPGREDYGHKPILFSKLFKVYKYGDKKPFLGPDNKFVDFGEYAYKKSKN
jgi:hypothetical protein